MKYIIYIAIFCFSINISFAQNFSNVFHEESTYSNDGDKHFAKGEYLASLYYYNKAYKLDQKNRDIIYKIASSHFELHNFTKAIEHYNKIEIEGRDDPYFKVNFYLGLCYKKVGELEKAHEHMKLFSKKNPDKKSPLHKKAKAQLKTIEMIRDGLIVRKPEVKVKNFGDVLNSTESEMSPMLYNDTLMVYGLYKHDSIEENNKVQLYSTIYKNKEFTEPKAFSFNNENLQDIANLNFNKDTTELIFTARDSITGLTALYSCFGSIGNWSEAVVFASPINNFEANTTQAQFVYINNKEYIIFVSDREGGKGGMDLWYVEKKKGKYRKPKNLRKLNTPGQELTPNYSPGDKKLYFSSDYKENLGGLDIFEVELKDLNSVKKVENVGAPINTPYNDLYYYAINKKDAFYVSNKLESSLITQDTFPCCNDIFLIENKCGCPPEDTSIIDPPVIEYCPEEEDLLADQNIALYFANDYPNPKTLDTTSRDNYIATYLKYAELLPSYVKGAKKGSKRKKDEIETELNEFFKDYVEAGMNSLKEFTETIRKELQQGKDVEITVKGYASPLAKSDYNERLTKRRIASFVNYLREYQNAVFVPYLDETAPNDPQLKIIKIPFGEYKADQTLSDDLDNAEQSIYSPQAGLERKIEIIGAKSIKKTKAIIVYPDSIVNTDTLYLPLNRKIDYNFTIKNGTQLNLFLKEIGAQNNIEGTDDENVSNNRIVYNLRPNHLAPCGEGETTITIKSSDKTFEGASLIRLKYQSDSDNKFYTFYIRIVVQNQE